MRLRALSVKELIVVVLACLSFGVIWAEDGFSVAARYMVMLVVLFAPVLGFSVFLRALLSNVGPSGFLRPGLIFLSTVVLSAVLLVLYVPRSLYTFALVFPLLLIVLNLGWRHYGARHRRDP